MSCFCVDVNGTKARYPFFISQYWPTRRSTIDTKSEDSAKEFSASFLCVDNEFGSRVGSR